MRCATGRWTTIEIDALSFEVSEEEKRSISSSRGKKRNYIPHMSQQHQRVINRSRKKTISKLDPSIIANAEKILNSILDSGSEHSLRNLLKHRSKWRLSRIVSEYKNRTNTFDFATADTRTRVQQHKNRRRDYD